MGGRPRTSTKEFRTSRPARHRLGWRYRVLPASKVTSDIQSGGRPSPLEVAMLAFEAVKVVMFMLDPALRDGMRPVHLDPPGLQVALMIGHPAHGANVPFSVAVPVG